MNRPTQRQILILLVDDDPLFLTTLKRMLGQVAGLKVVATAADGDTGVQLACELEPDVVLMDVHMKGMCGIEATRRILAAAPGVRVLGLSGYMDRESVIGIIRAGAAGYLLKPAQAAEVTLAIREVAANRQYLSPAVSAAVVKELQQCPRRVAASLAPLTDREREVLQLIGAGHRNKAIAEMLGLSVKTVEAHRAALRLKLAVRGTAELIQIARASQEPDRAPGSAGSSK